jgi:hypothetical protein
VRIIHLVSQEAERIQLVEQKARQEVVRREAAEARARREIHGADESDDETPPASSDSESEDDS